MSNEKIKLQKGDKIIERNKIDWEKNQNMWKFRGYTLAEDKPKLSLVTKKKKKWLILVKRVAVIYVFVMMNVNLVEHK